MSDYTAIRNAKGEIRVSCGETTISGTVGQSVFKGARAAKAKYAVLAQGHSRVYVLSLLSSDSSLSTALSHATRRKTETIVVEIQEETNEA